MTKQLITKKMLLDAAKTKFPTPCSQEKVQKLCRKKKIQTISEHVRGIMDVLGLDLSDESMKDTPDRVATMYVDEIFFGLNLKAFPNITTFEHPDSVQNVGQLIVTRVSIVSFCEHHLVPMIGAAYIGYLPKKRVIGLSKLSRIARYFAARPQLQERLTAQIADSLATLLSHNDVAVLITAQHTCVVARGAKDESSETSTLFTSGIFQSSNDQKQQFFNTIHHLNNSNSNAL
jgi:GTP cyclohydrolase I